MIIDIHDVWDAAALQHEQYIRKKMGTAWTELYKIGPPTEVLAKVHAFVQKHEAEIVGAASRNYVASTDDYDQLFPNGSAERKSADLIVNRVFNYSNFRDSANGWGAYALCASSPYKVCPYCHLTPMGTKIKSGGYKGYRPQLDHFIARSDYPFLALSLGNLVPSCGDCNGPFMKHDTKVLTDPHLFPLVDAPVLVFTLRPKGGKSWSPLHRALRVPSDDYEILIEAPGKNVAAANSLRTFNLASRYQSYLHDAYRIAKINKNPAWLQTIAEILRIRPSVDEQLGFPINGRSWEFKNIPQGKMRKDVYLDSRKW